MSEDNISYIIYLYVSFVCSLCVETHQRSLWLPKRYTEKIKQACYMLCYYSAHAAADMDNQPVDHTVGLTAQLLLDAHQSKDYTIKGVNVSEELFLDSQVFFCDS